MKIISPQSIRGSHKSPIDKVYTDKILSPKWIRGIPQYSRDNKYTFLIDKGQSPSYRGLSLNDRGLCKY